MKYDDMKYKNSDWKSDKDLISEAYEDLFKVYAERNRKLQEASHDNRTKEELDEEEKDLEKQDQEHFRVPKSHKQKQIDDAKKKKGLEENNHPDRVDKDGKVWHDVTDEEDDRDDDEYEKDKAENAKLNGDKKKGLEETNHSVENALKDDEDVEHYKRTGEIRKKVKKAKDKHDKEKSRKDKPHSNHTGYEAGGMMDVMGGAFSGFEESQMTINELWALCGTGEEVWNESGEPTNELNTKVGDTIFFTWNYRPDDPDSCRTLRSAKIVD